MYLTLDPGFGVAGATRRARLLARPLAASMVVHAVALALLAWLVASGSERIPEYAPAPITATLVTAEHRFVVAEREPAASPASPVSAEPDATAAPAAVAPKLRPAPTVQGTPQGRVIVHVLPVERKADPSVEALMQKRYPDATRVHLQFEVPPKSIYPKAALADRKQLQLLVAAVVHEDGRVEFAEGQFADSMFGPAIVAMLASAKAEPPLHDGKPRAGWLLLDFLFEYVGSP